MAFGSIGPFGLFGLACFLGGGGEPNYMFVAPFEFARFDQSLDRFLDKTVTVFDVGKANFFGRIFVLIGR